MKEVLIYLLEAERKRVQGARNHAGSSGSISQVDFCERELRKIAELSTKLTTETPESIQT